MIPKNQITITEFKVKEAKQAIEKHRLEMREKRKAFFRRPDKKLKK